MVRREIDYHIGLKGEDNRKIILPDNIVYVSEDEILHGLLKIERPVE